MTNLPDQTLEELVDAMLKKKRKPTFRTTLDVEEENFQKFKQICKDKHVKTGEVIDEFIRWFVRREL